MAAIRHLAVEGLFGKISHSIAFSEESPITILAGPNGVGKTHVLRILRGMLALDGHKLAAQPFSVAEVGYADGSVLRVSRSEGRHGADEGENDRASLRVSFREASSMLYPDTVAELGDELDPDGERIPPWIERSDDRWFDRRSGRYLSDELVARRYGVFHRDRARARLLRDIPALAELSNANEPIFIDTKRLDNPPSRSAESEYQSSRSVVTSRIAEYADRIRAQVTEARRASLVESQEADQQFAPRVLEKARTTIKESELKRRYQRIAALQSELHTNGLAASSMGVSFPDQKTNPTERRVLNVFLDDWERKLQPLVPVNDKLKILRRVVNEKFRGKEFALSPRGEILFLSDSDVPLRAEQLSSGEQHLLALFTMMLFAADRGSVVLVDEPEISLHAAWKHAFLADIEEVAGVSGLSVVLATHSSSLINGRWDLVRELGFGDE